MFANAADELAVTEQWAAAHELRRGDPHPDVEKVTASVRIVPGETLALDMEMRVTAPADRPLDELLFSFNPGMGVDAVSIDGRDDDVRPHGRIARRGVAGATRGGFLHCRVRARTRRSRPFLRLPRQRN